MSKPEGLELVKQLLRLSDVVVENFAAGVIERLGLGYDVVAAVKPDIIMVSSSGTGHSGPHKDYVAYGSLLQHYTGWNGISGYPNREPIKGGLWADPWVGMELAMVTLAALNHRAVTGAGQYIDLSMAEALSASTTEGDTTATRAARSNTTVNTVCLQDGPVMGFPSIQMVHTA